MDFSGAKKTSGMRMIHERIYHNPLIKAILAIRNGECSINKTDDILFVELVRSGTQGIAILQGREKKKRSETKT